LPLAQFQMQSQNFKEKEGRKKIWRRDFHFAICNFQIKVSFYSCVQYFLSFLTTLCKYVVILSFNPRTAKDISSYALLIRKSKKLKEERENLLQFHGNFNNDQAQQESFRLDWGSILIKESFNPRKEKFLYIYPISKKKIHVPITSFNYFFLLDCSYHCLSRPSKKFVNLLFYTATKIVYI